MSSSLNKRMEPRPCSSWGKSKVNDALLEQLPQAVKRYPIKIQRTRIKNRMKKNVDDQHSFCSQKYGY